MTVDRRGILKQSGGALALSMLPQFQKSHALEKSKPRIKIGQIGVGHAHASKLEVYRASSDYEVVGIVEPDARLRQRAEAQACYRDLRWMTQEQLLATPGLQVVLVETRVRDLLTTAEACVAARKHVHIDKPAGESLPQLKKILDDATRQKLMVQMGYMYRYNPGVILLKQFLAQKWLGDIFEVHTVMSKVVDPASRRALAEYKGGMMFELGCHVVDLVVGILGKPAQVFGFNQHAGRHEDTLLDNSMAVFSYEHAIASVKTAAMEVDGGDRRHLVVCGSEGTFQIQPLDNPSAKLVLSHDRPGYKKGSQEIKFPRYNRYVADAADMASVIRGEKPSDYPPQHDLAVQETLLKACGLPTGT